MQVTRSLLCTSVEILPSRPNIFPKSVGFSPYFTKEIVYLQKELTKVIGILNISFINQFKLFLRSYFDPAQYYPAFIHICHYCKQPRGKYNFQNEKEFIIWKPVHNGTCFSSVKLPLDLHIL